MNARSLQPSDGERRMDTMPERLARLEERVSGVKNDVAKIQTVVDDIHSIILQGKGVKWVIIGAVGLFSSFFGSYAHKLLSFFTLQK